jgi:hypothetical protein
MGMFHPVMPDWSPLQLSDYFYKQIIIIFYFIQTKKINKTSKISEFLVPQL